jgi:hypothetical protein
MSGHDHAAASRADLARWFLAHDEVDEAARVLEPGDELELGDSDHRDLAAALARRGLGARYEARRVVVAAPVAPAEGAMPPRKPPARATAPAPTAIKKQTA